MPAAAAIKNNPVNDPVNSSFKEMLDNYARQSRQSLIQNRNAEIEAIKGRLPSGSTSFFPGAAITGGGYGLGRLAASRLGRFSRSGRFNGNRVGLLAAALLAGGIGVKDRLLPGKVKLPGNIADQWVDPSVHVNKPSPTLWSLIQQTLPFSKSQEPSTWDTTTPHPLSKK